jgi:beta-glucosidase
VLDSWKAKAPAILFSWYTGMSGGDALANILFEKISPSGKLPFTIPKKTSDLPPFNSFADTAFYGYYHGYSLMDKKEISASFPFGFGLSYTSFRIENLEINSPTIGKLDTLSVSIDLRNDNQIKYHSCLVLFVSNFVKNAPHS